MLSEEAAFYHGELLSLARERQSMAGFAVALPLPLPRTVIEAHAARQGIDAGELREYVEIIAAIDDGFIEIETKRMLAEIKADSEKRRGAR